MIGPCLMVAGSFRVTCQDARGLRAGATIAVLGGLRAERKASMATTTHGDWKIEMDQALERIWQNINEAKRIREGKPPERHLRLLPPREKEHGDA
jgi:hypothetical protein